MVTHHSFLALAANPATVTAAGILRNVVVADMDATVTAPVAVVVVSVTLIIQRTVAADICSGTCTQE